MIRRTSLPILALLLLPALLTGQSESSTYRIEKLADGVYAALEPRALRFNDSNSLILIGDDGVVVVDSQAKPSKVRELIAEIRDLTDQPVRYVINTHWHGDHTEGNQAYRDAFPGVEFVAHHTVVEDIPARAAPYRHEQIEAYENGIADAEERLEKGLATDGSPMSAEERERLPGAIERGRATLAELQAIEDVLPTVTYDDEMVLWRGGREIRLMHFRAHTRGDTVVYLPGEKILATGDLLDELPFGGHGYPSSWIETLDRIEMLDFDRIVPGHGDVLEGKGQLRLIRDLLRAVSEKVAPLAAAGKSLEEVQETVDLERFRELLAGDDEVAQRNFKGFMPPLVERVYLEAKGEIDVPAEDTQAPGKRKNAYTSAFGLSFQVPAGWVVVSKATLQNDPGLLDKLVEQGVSERLLSVLGAQVETGESEVLLRVDGGSEELQDNVSILRQDLDIPASPEELEPVCAALPSSFATAFGRDIEVHACRLEEVSGKPALFLEFDGAVPGTRGFQYQIGQKPGVAVFLTATVQLATLKEFRAELAELIASIEFP